MGLCWVRLLFFHGCFKRTPIARYSQLSLIYDLVIRVEMKVRSVMVGRLGYVLSENRGSWLYRNMSIITEIRTPQRVVRQREACRQDRRERGSERAGVRWEECGSGDCMNNEVADWRCPRLHAALMTTCSATPRLSKSHSLIQPHH